MHDDLYCPPARATIHIPTLFLSIVLISATLALAVGLVAERAQRDGLSLFAAGMAAQTLAYGLLSLRGGLPDVFTVWVPNVLLSATFALFGEALYQFHARRPDRRLLWLPVGLSMLAFGVLLNELPARLLAGPLIFGAQILTLLALIVRARGATVGRGRYFLFGGLAALLPVLGLRAAAALQGGSSIADFHTPSLLQSLTYAAVMASTLFTTLGYVLMCKEGADHQNRQLALIDELTGLPNRRWTLQGLAQQLAAAQRSGQALTVMMLDIDHFKRVNDQHGHLVGDTALRHVAQTLRGRLRAQDLLGRFGGEEFLAVLPATAAQGGLPLAEKLRAAVAATPLGGDAAPALVLTVSIGVAEAQPGRACNVQCMIKAADQAMYRAKAAGRNRVEAAQPADFGPPADPAPA